MHYVVTDEFGNTPLLQVLQSPNTLSQAQIIEILNRRLSSGTLVVEEIAGQTPLLRGNFENGRRIQLIEVKSEHDPDFTVHLLGITREELFAFFDQIDFEKLAERKRQNIYDKIGRDMVDQLELGEIKIHQEYSNLLKKYKAALANLPLSEKDVERYYDELLSYCANQDVYTWYINHLKTNSNLSIGLNILTLYASHYNLPFCIWGQNVENTNKLKLIAKVPGGARKTIHILRGKGGFNYKLLFENNERVINQTVMRNYRLIKKQDPLNELNNHKQNLLHAAVQNIHTAFLVPLLIHQLNFKMIINNQDGELNTALHLAVKSFSELHHSAIVVVDSTFYLSLTICLTALLTAGIDIYRVNSRNKTAFDYARELEQKTNIPNLYVSTWLQQLSFCQPQTIAVRPSIVPLPLTAKVDDAEFTPQSPYNFFSTLTTPPVPPATSSEEEEDAEVAEYTQGRKRRASTPSVQSTYQLRPRTPRQGFKSEN